MAPWFSFSMQSTAEEASTMVPWFSSFSMQPTGAETTAQLAPSSRSSSSSNSRSVLRDLREEFRSCGGSEDRPITAADIARHWHKLAEDDRSRLGMQPPNSQERTAIALRATQTANGMGLRLSGTVHVDEWVHDRLLAMSGLPNTALAAQINSALQWELQNRPSLLAEVQWMLEVADSSESCFLSFEDMVQAYRDKLWRLASGPEGLKVLSDSELSYSDPSQLARDILQASDLDGIPNRLSYAELLAFCLGREKQAVSLALYDLSDGLARRLSPYILGQQLDGLWHTSVLAFGIEYFFGGDICRSVPGQTKFGKITKLLPLGVTLRTPMELEAFLSRGLKADFTRESYDILTHNCNHFSDRVSLYLVGRRIPEEVLRQPECASNAPALLQPLLNHWLSGAEARARTGQEGNGAKSRPPPLSRRPAAYPGADMQQHLDHGQVVSILPRPGEIAQAVIGQVIRGGSPLPPAPANRVWVQYYKPPFAQHGGELRTELVELHRIQQSQAAMGRSFVAAMHALNGPQLPHSSRRDTGSSLVQLTSFGCKARHAEAALSLGGGSMARATAILRFQGQARQALGEIVLKPDNEGDQLTVIYSSLGVPTVLPGAPDKASLLAPPGQMRWASPPKDQLSRSTGARMLPRDDIRSRRMSQPGSQPVLAGGACTPVFPVRPPGFGELRRATEIQGGARRMSVTGLSGLGGA
eukprot:TRINITY_DN76319_c0_g1_i1.p1 TRINITY_DN76319_c0_g1~~TRINITY_DN76319_c0_g1_i1.p1  ORF type:complete len:700 (-),score=124.08 TRINITY_DN76319_c0_g1_i1:41-2140(-)